MATVFPACYVPGCGVTPWSFLPTQHPGNMGSRGAKNGDGRHCWNETQAQKKGDNNSSKGSEDEMN